MKRLIFILFALIPIFGYGQFKPRIISSNNKIVTFNSNTLVERLTYKMFEIDASSGAFTQTLTLAGQSGEYMSIDWGDGQDTTFQFSGSNQNITHNYALGAYRQYWILQNTDDLTYLDASSENLYGNINETDILEFTKLTDLRINNNSLTGNISTWNYGLSFFESIEVFRIDNNSLTGDISSWAAALANWSSIRSFLINSNSFTGDISGWSIALSNWSNIQAFYLYSNSFTGDISGWSIALSNWSGINNFRIYDNSFTGDISSWSIALSNWSSISIYFVNSNSFTGISNTETTAISQFNASGNAITSTTQINNLFSDFDAYFSSNSPIKNLTINVSGGTNASPTGGASNTNITNLESTYTTAGYVFTAIIN